jgi:O-antigen/teichoic acid export membrane protein
MKAQSGYPNGMRPREAERRDSEHGVLGGLTATIARGLSWAAAARALTAVGNIARYAVFARLLTPYDFGVTTTALLTLDMLTALTSPSFEKSLIQQREEIEPFMDTVWSFSVVRGILLALLLVAFARPFAGFFRQPEAYVVFLAVAPLAVFRAVQSPAWIALFRRLEFHVVLMLNGAELLGSLIIGVPAILWWGDWRGLVAATIAGQMARTLLSYYYFPYRPRARFSFDRFKRMFKYGRWVTGTGIAEFASQQVDNFVVAHVLGPRSVGDYQMAFRIGEMPGTELAYSASLVTFPIAAKLVDRKRERNKLFFYTAAAVVALGIGYGVFMVATGDEIIRVLFGTKWLGAAPALRVLSFYGLFQGLQILGKSFLDGIGAPEASFNTTALRAVVLVATIYPLTMRYGTSGAAMAALFSVLVPVPVMFMLYRRAESAEARGLLRNKWDHADTRSAMGS